MLLLSSTGSLQPAEAAVAAGGSDVADWRQAWLAAVAAAIPVANADAG